MRVFCVSLSLITLVLCFSISAGENATEMAMVAARVKRLSITGQPTQAIAIPKKSSKKRLESDESASDTDDSPACESKNSTPTSYLALPSPASLASVNSISPCSAPSSRRTSPDSRGSNDSWGSRLSSFSFDLSSSSGSFFPPYRYGQRGSH